MSGLTKLSVAALVDELGALALQAAPIEKRRGELKAELIRRQEGRKVATDFEGERFTATATLSIRETLNTEQVKAFLGERLPAFTSRAEVWQVRTKAKAL